MSMLRKSCRWTVTRRLWEKRPQEKVPRAMFIYCHWNMRRRATRRRSLEVAAECTWLEDNTANRTIAQYLDFFAHGCSSHCAWVAFSNRVHVCVCIFCAYAAYVGGKLRALPWNTPSFLGITHWTVPAKYVLSWGQSADVQLLFYGYNKVK